MAIQSSDWGTQGEEGALEPHKIPSSVRASETQNYIVAVHLPIVFLPCKLGMEVLWLG